MEDEKGRDSRLLRLIAAQSEQKPVPKKFRRAADHVPPPQSRLDETELRAFVNEELSEQRMSEIEEILKRDPTGFARFISLRLEETGPQPDTPQALRATARNAFVGGHEIQTQRLGAWEKLQEFLDRFLAPWLRLPVAGAMAAAAVLLAVIFVGAPGVDGDDLPIVVADLGLEGRLRLRGANVEDLISPSGATAKQLADALLRDRPALLSEALIELITTEGRPLDRRERMRLVEELNRSVTGSQAALLDKASLTAKIEPDSFNVVAVSESLSIIISQKMYADGMGIRVYVFSLSPSELGLSDSELKGILYLDLNAQ